MKKCIILLLLVIGSYLPNQACSFTPDFFCENINVDNPDFYVFSGRVVDTIEFGIRFALMDRLRGAEARDTITIWDGKPFQCTGTWNLFARDLGEISETLILALPKIEQPDTSWQQQGDYTLPNVYAYITNLQVRQGRVQGYIAGTAGLEDTYVEDLPYADFVEHVISTPSCARVVDTEEALDRALFLRVAPNPFAERLQIRGLESHSEDLEIFLHTPGGQTVLRTIWNGQEALNTSSLPGGMYILTVTSESGLLISRRKVVKKK